MKIRDLMNKDFICLSPDDTISKFISTMHKYKTHEVPLLEKKKLIGMVYYTDITKKGFVNPEKTKLRNVMSFQPPTVSPDQTIEEAAELIFKTGLRALPVIENQVMIGLVSIYDLITVVSKSKEFRQNFAESIMSTPEVVNMETDIGKIRVLMREKHYSRVPVVDSKGKLIGSVDIFDLGKAIIPRERMGFYSMSAEKEKTMGISVSTIMDTDSITAERNSTLNDIANLMERNKTSEVIITDNNFPIGIVTIKDLLEVFISGLQTKGVYYQIIGLTDEDEFIVSTAQRMVEDTIEKISRMFKIYSFFVHVKIYQEHGEKAKYSIRTRLRTAKGTYISKSYDWDLRDAVNSALHNLERIIIKEKTEGKDKRRKMLVKYKSEFK